MITTTSQHSFLLDIVAVDVAHGIAMFNHGESSTGIPVADRAIADTLTTGLPSIKQSFEDEDDCVVMSVPVYRNAKIISLAVFVGNTDPGRVGVLELWQPIGEYDELNLTGGYYGALDRFQNVSSFVRFEKGSGLPGQVWRNHCFVVHDNLPSHVGFLRAAGASAESLQVAFGIPVFAETFLASAVLISSDASPIARGYEVWRRTDECFQLESKAYQRLDESLMLDEGSTLALQGTLPALAIEKGSVCISEDREVVYCGRPDHQGKPCKGIAIPFFEADRVTNVLTLLL